MPDEASMGELLYRVGQIERQISNGRSPALLRQELDDMKGDLAELRKEQKEGFARINRGLWFAAATFASLTVGVAGLIANLH